MKVIKRADQLARKLPLEAEKPSRFPDADLYQMLAYCTALDLKLGHLVYAKGNENPARYIVRDSGVEVVCHALDLGRPPPELLRQVRGLAREIIAGTVAQTASR